MIAKQVSMKVIRKSSATNLIKYITDPQNKAERVDMVSVTNCHQSDPLDAALEIQATQAQNTRAEGDKTYHLVLAFPPGENPEPKILKEIESRICDGLGFSEHQRVSAVHRDTDNLHIHIAINKIHPQDFTIHTPYYDHKTLGQLCEKLEEEYGLEKVNHQSKKRGSENRADDMERHSGIESLLSWIKRECLEDIKLAESWNDMHKVLKDNDLEIKLRGNGLIIESSDGIIVKASTVARELSKPKLEERLGSFVSSPDHQDQPKKAKRQYQAKPIKTQINTVELYAKYKANQKQINQSRASEWEKARARKNRAIKSIKQSGQVKRSAIKLMGKGRLAKKILYSQTSKATKEAIQKVNKKYFEERQTIYEKYQRQAWADWLKTKATEGDKEALDALRAREARKGFKENTVRGQGKKSQEKVKDAVQDSVTKKGTIIYRVGKAAIRDDGDRIQISRENTHRSLEAALKLAVSRYGKTITVNGTDAFKEQIAQVAAQSKLEVVFDDVGLEYRRQQLLNKKQQEKTDNEQRRKDRGRETNGNSVNTGTDARSDRGNEGHGRVRGTDRTRGRGRIRGNVKPNVGRVGRKPPPERQNRLRNLSQCGVVRPAKGSEVLLSGDVSNRVEQQGAQSIPGLRRGISGGRINDQKQAAADKYIVERNTKRVKIVDISKHRHYNEGEHPEASFSGIRKIDGQSLVLLKRDNEIIVLPIDAAAERRLKKLSIGDVVMLTKKGTVTTTKGRSR